ncbi:GntR family transcriptional regulator [Streptomyces viridochromogenes]|uniref:GntR family transcriptional regulator n=1 Tax=Streptomyces viridochromogenes TaxID=1938 RepID=A0A0J7ZEE9_STRVR|nr:GntR family transcriptional regulator [Streptomyces viridochromogenes]KMS74209.1 GntR family transcriptional regulator [Streptomyces viridochromogenes]
MNTPLYLQVADALRAEINDRTFPPGADLPSERELMDRFDASRNTVRSGLKKLASEGLITSSQGRSYRVVERQVFILNTSRFENLQFSSPEAGDAYDNEVLHAGRVPKQEFRVQLVELPDEIAERLQVEPRSPAVLRFCLRYVDDTPWSTQATYYPQWLVDAHPRLAEPRDIEEGTTRYLASRGVEQIGTLNDVEARMPSPVESRELRMGTGVPVLIWTRTGYTSDRPVRCTISTFHGNLNRLTWEQGDLRALGQAEETLR